MRVFDDAVSGNSDTVVVPVDDPREAKVRRCASEIATCQNNRLLGVLVLHLSGKKRVLLV